MINFFHLKKFYGQIYLNPFFDCHNFNLTHAKIEKKNTHFQLATILHYELYGGGGFTLHITKQKNHIPHN
jgi:hypothetical protein